MKARALTFAAVWIVLALVADVVFAFHGGEKATISWQVQSVLHEFPVVAYAVGFVSGHLFWQLKNEAGNV